MNLVEPFAGVRPAPGLAKDVIALPNDILDGSEARRRAQDRPFSFLHVSKAEIDLPPGTSAYNGAVYEKARENFDRMLMQGVLRRDANPCYYIYRLESGNHSQTGLMAALPIAAYETARIRRHELTRPETEDDRARQIEVLNAHT
jgi:uncharacterized protein (DUF1015 family)